MGAKNEAVIMHFFVCASHRVCGEAKNYSFLSSLSLKTSEICPIIKKTSEIHG
jgi:hypothetical protein